jgi:DNA-binding CsgD family transcriptional regulator/tetratricopeptide (TPR) repeat protein
MDDNLEIILPREIYLSNLKTVNEVAFTAREIDIISCVLQGRSSKRIASMLMISHKTVENHIRNIMIKIGCNSQESIIDFIEKSNKFVCIKSYYSSLLVKINFEAKLIKLKELLPYNRLTCLIFCHQAEKNRSALICQLEEHLKLIGIKTLVEIKEAKDVTVSSFNNTGYTIYCVSEASMEKLKDNFKELQFLQSEKTIFLAFDQISFDFFKNHDLYKNNCIDVIVPKKYYFAFFEMLAKIFPEVNIEKNVTTFKEHSTILLETCSISKSVTKNDSPLYSIYKYALGQKRLVSLSVLCILLCLWLLHKNVQTASNKNKEQKSFFIDNKKGKHTNINHVFRGELYKLFSDSHTVNSNIVLIAITGFPGTGKTILAEDYSDLYINNINHSNKIRWFIRAENENIINEDYKKLATQLEIKFNSETPIIEVIKRVNTKLQEFANFIIIFDDVKSYDNIVKFIPTNKEIKGNIVVTSKYSNIIPSNKWKILTVSLNQGMSETESMMLLSQIIGKSEDHSAKLLLKRLGGLPLALAQSANYMVNEKLNCLEYLKLYEQKYENSYDSEIQNANNFYDFPDILDKTLRLSIDNISPETQELLYLIAYLDSNCIPESLFKSSSEYSVKLDPMLRELANRSLINRDLKKESFSIHKVVQDVTRAIIHQKSLLNHDHKEEYYINKVLQLIHVEHRSNIITEHDYYKKRYLIPHLNYSLSFYDFTKSIPANQVVVQANIDLALLYKAIGMAQTAKEYYNKILTVISKVNDKMIIAEAYKGLGRAHQGSGNFELAKNFYEKSYNIYLQLNYHNSPEMAEILNDLGMIFRDIGHSSTNKNVTNYYEKAAEHLEQAVLINGKMPMHKQNTIRYLTNLGEVYRKLGRLEQAEQIIIKAIEISQKEYVDQKHRLVASAHFNLGRVYMDKKSYQAAQLCFDKAVEISLDENVCGKSHPLSARYLNSLGLAWRKLKVEQNACRHFKEAHDTLENGGFGQKQLLAEVCTNFNSCYKK